MRKKTMIFACALMLAAIARAQWSGLEVKTIGTTPATTLNSGYYALFQNGHKGFAFLSETMLNLWGTNYNLAKNRINANAPGISAFADLNQNIASGPAPNDRKWYVFKITNNGNGTCTIQCPDGTYIPAFGNRVKLVSSATPGVFTFHNHGNYFSFVSNGQGLNGDNYQAGYDNVSTLASWDYNGAPAANGNAAWTLYPVEMTAPINTSKHYLLKHVQTGLYLYLHDNYQETRHVDATTLREVGTPFIFTKNGTGYTLTQVGTTKTLGCSNGTWAAWNTANNVATPWQFTPTGDGNDTYYISSEKGLLSANRNEATNGAFVYTNHPQQTEAKWQLVEAGTVIGNPLPDKVFALYNACTNGDYPVIGNPGIATSTTAAPQLYVLRAAGADPKGTSLFRLQKAGMDGKYLTWTNNSPTSVTHSDGISKFLFVNNTKSGYAWNSGTAPVAPLYNFVGYADNNYTVFSDKKSTSNTGFDGYSRRTATTLLNNAQGNRGSVYNTTWRLYQQPYEVYNVVIKGNAASTTPTLTYSHPLDNAITHTPQKNGGSFVISYDALSTLTVENFTPQQLEEHTCKVELHGNTVTVTYKNKVNVTYVYMQGDYEIKRESFTTYSGSPYPDIQNAPANTRFTTIPLGNVEDDTTFVVNTKFLPAWRITPSSTYEDANWVYLSMGETDKKFLYYDAANPSYIPASAAPQNSDAYKWAFIVNPFTGAHKIINKAAGDGKILSSPSMWDGNNGNSTFPHMVEDSDSLENTGMNRYWTFGSKFAALLMARKGNSQYCNIVNNKLAFRNNSINGNSYFYIVPIVDAAPVSGLENLKDNYGNPVQADKTYRLVNRESGNVIQDALAWNKGTHYEKMNGRKDENAQKWTIDVKDNGFKVRNKNSNLYMTADPKTDDIHYYSEGWQYWLPVGHLREAEYKINFFEADEVDGKQYYYITGASALSSANNSVRSVLGCDHSNVFPNSTGDVNGQWLIECTTAPASTQPAATFTDNIISGGHYRLINNYYSGQAMTDDNGNLTTTGRNNKNYAQVWQITGSNGNYTFKNLLTGRYIKQWSGGSQQWKTVDANSAGKFYSSKNGEGENATFWFAAQNNTNSSSSLHSSPSNTVVEWAASAEASIWKVLPVEVTEADIAAAADQNKTVSNNFTNQLAAFFTDAACTQLKSNYASMSDAQLRNAMSALPTALQDEAIHVKNNKWNADPSWNYHEKKFRIHDYRIYTNSNRWTGILGTGPYGHITQPTGIRLKAGEIAYLLVENNVTDGDAQLLVEQIAGTNFSGTQKALKKGYNYVLAGSDCELFITYQSMNPNKKLSLYPDIKIHIAGGTCNGAFDMNRGHTNNDWKWLNNNMFKNQYLHLRSNHHVLCAYHSKLKGAGKVVDGLKTWDFVFETEEKLTNTYFGGDKYRPTMVAYDNDWSTSPNWNSGLGRVAIPNINTEAVDINTFLNSNGGQLWLWSHEEGHAHQSPIMIAGTAEISNNGYANIVNFLWGMSTARGTALPARGGRFNQGQGWFDISRDAGLAHKMWFQLWLYFHQKGDDGFFARWIQKIRARGGLQRGSSSNPINIDKDYMLLALAACEASQTDLYEFFKSWGFFTYAEDMGFWANSNKDGRYNTSEYIFHHYFKIPRKSVPAEVALMEGWKAEMQSYPNKAPGAMFINDTGELGTISEGAECLKYRPSLLGRAKVYADDAAKNGAGSTGHYLHFGVNEADNLGFTLDGTTVNITGSGAVGYKIYDDTGELIWISFWNSFNTNEAIANGIANGTYSLVASLGDDTDLLLSGPGTMYTGYANNAKSLNDGAITDVKSIETNDNTGETKIYDLQGRQLKSLQKGINIVNGKKVIVK